MPSATDFLPSYMMAFMNLLTTILPNFGSGMMSRFSAAWRRDMTLILTWAVSRRTSNGVAYGFSRPVCRAHRAGCDSEHPEDPSRGRHVSLRPSAPADCDLRQECNR